MSKAVLIFGLVMFFAEVHWLYKLERKYWRDDETSLSVDEFITRASFEDILKARHHCIAGFLAICLATIGSLRLFQ